MAKSAAASWLPGALAVFFAHLAWIGLVIGQAHAEWLMGAIIVMSFVTSNSAGIGAFVTALRAPRHGFLLGLGMAPLAAVLAVISNLAVRLAGVHIDLSGFRVPVSPGVLTVSSRTVMNNVGERSTRCPIHHR